MSILLISAQDVGVDDQGNPNDPTINERANACYTDPRFLDQCDTPIEWFCGYTIIRYDYGLLDDVTVEMTVCADYLPPDIPIITPSITPNMVVPMVNCVLNAGFNNYTNFMGGNYLPSNAPVYSDNACTIQINTWGPPVVYTPNGAGVAEQLCLMNGNLGLDNVYGDVYSCIP